MLATYYSRLRHFQTNNLGRSSDSDLIHLEWASNAVFFRITHVDSNVQLGIQVTYLDDKILFLYFNRDFVSIWLHPGLGSSSREGPVLTP